MVLEKILTGGGVKHALEIEDLIITRDEVELGINDYYLRKESPDIQPASVDLGFGRNMFSYTYGGLYVSEYSSFIFMKMLEDYIPEGYRSKFLMLTEIIEEEANSDLFSQIIPPYSVSTVFLNERVHMEDLLLRVTTKSRLGRLGLTVNHPARIVRRQNHDHKSGQFSFNLVNKTPIPWYFERGEKIVQGFFQPIDANLEPVYSQEMYGRKTGEHVDLRAGSKATIIEYDKLICQIIDNMGHDYENAIMEFSKRDQILKPFMKTVEFSAKHPYHMKMGGHGGFKTSTEVNLSKHEGWYLDKGANAGWVDPGFKNGPLFPNPGEGMIMPGDIIARAYKYEFPHGVQEPYGTKGSTHQGKKSFTL